MERQPNLLSQPEATASAESFTSRWRRKTKKRQVEAVAPQTPEVAVQPSQESAPQPSRERFAGRLALLLFGEKKQQDPTGPENTARVNLQATPEVPEPIVYERAARMRRFARVVTRQVMGTAEAEQKRTSPLATEPLVAAAEDLTGAAEELDDTMQAATMHSGVNVEGGGYSGGAESGAYLSIEKAASGVIANRLMKRVQQLERKAEVNEALAPAAFGLGILAVILVGFEYSARKKGQRALKKELRQQKEIMTDQSAAFEQLQRQQKQVEAMARAERKDYYQRLSTFTHEQADTTREVTRELREVIVPEQSDAMLRIPRGNHAPEAPAIEWQAIRASEQKEAAKPLVRVETADTIESQPGQFTKNTPSLGGGAAGSAGRAATDTPGVSPLSLQAIHREEALRQARAARLKSNAWMYGVALAGAAIITVILVLVLG